MALKLHGIKGIESGLQYDLRIDFCSCSMSSLPTCSTLTERFSSESATDDEDDFIACFSTFDMVGDGNFENGDSDTV